MKLCSGYTCDHSEAVLLLNVVEVHVGVGGDGGVSGIWLCLFVCVSCAFVAIRYNDNILIDFKNILIDFKKHFNRF